MNQKVFTITGAGSLSGFLLGKFVSDRQQIIRQLKQERDSNPIKNLEVAVNALIPVAANLTRHQNELFHPDTNTKLWFSWKECYKIPESANYDLKPVDFASNLVYSYLKLMNQCFNRMAYILTHLEDN